MHLSNLLAQRNDTACDAVQRSSVSFGNFGKPSLVQASFKLRWASHDMQGDLRLLRSGETIRRTPPASLHIEFLQSQHQKYHTHLETLSRAEHQTKWRPPWTRYVHPAQFRPRIADATAKIDQGHRGRSKRPHFRKRTDRDSHPCSRWPRPRRIRRRLFILV